jgi:hypothetical protein
MHEPNFVSGGAPSEMEVGTFLATGGRGPEKQELQRIIGTLTENDNHESQRGILSLTLKRHWGTPIVCCLPQSDANQ